MISILIPCYNETSDFVELFAQINDAFKSEENFEFILIDDGSTNITTKTQISNLRNLDNSCVRIIENSRNYGYGFSLKRGILEARNNLIGFMDADDSYRVCDLKQIYNKALDKNLDMVVGVRKGKYYRGSLLKMFLRFMLKRLAIYMCSRDIPDINSGIRVIRKDKFFPFLDIISNRFSFTTSLTLIAHQHFFNFQYLEVTYLKRRGRSHVKLWRDGVTAVGQILAISTYSNPLKVSFLFFSIASLSFIIAIFLTFLTKSLFFILFSLILTLLLLLIFFGLVTHALKDYLN